MVKKTTSDQARNRTGGKFQKGKSGNPGGRPKENAEVKELARAHTEEAIRTLVKWMKSKNAKASVAACNALLDRAWGKATQPLSGEDGKPLVAPIINMTVGGERKTLSVGTQ